MSSSEEALIRQLCVGVKADYSREGKLRGVMLTLGDVLLLAEVIWAVGLAALRATSPPAGDDNVTNRCQFIQFNFLTLNLTYLLGGLVCVGASVYLFLEVLCER